MAEFVKGKFIKRYKRFLIDVKLPDGQIVIAHCTNTGSLKSCLIPNSDVIFSVSTNPNRKTRFTWEMIKINNSWVGINTNMANTIAYHLLKNNQIPGFQNLNIIKREVKFDKSRFDLYAEKDSEKIFIEVKNVTYKDGPYALFPDSPTTRGQKHIKQLLKAKEQGFRVALFFIIQRTDVDIFSPAWNIDPQYARLLLEAENKGVEIIPLQIKIKPGEYKLIKILNYKLTNS